MLCLVQSVRSVSRCATAVALKWAQLELDFSGPPYQNSERVVKSILSVKHVVISHSLHTSVKHYHLTRFSRLAAVLQISISTQCFAFSPPHHRATSYCLRLFLFRVRACSSTLHLFFPLSLSVLTLCLPRPPRRQDKPWLGNLPTLLLRANIITCCTAWRRPR